jgi:ABC-2 type transport system permease protein
MFGALLYLRVVSLRNRITGSVKRLRQPKYLISALAGAAYLYLMFFRRMRLLVAVPSAPGMPAGAGLMGAALTPDLVLTLAATLLLLYLLIQFTFAWISPATQPRLRFSEPEIAFLFPAPITRLRLIHFNLLSAQFTILLSSVVLTVVLNRWSSLGGNALARAIGWWLIISTVSLQNTSNQLSVARQLQRTGGKIRALVLGAVALFVGALVYSVWQRAKPPAPGDLKGLGEMLRYATGLVDSGLLHRVLGPFKWVAGPFAANTARSFALAIGPALVIPALFYLAIVRLEVSFAEGSIAHAERRAQVKAAWRAGNYRRPGARVKSVRAPFALRDRGRPEIAFFWKNLIAIQSWFSLRIFRFVLPALVVIGAINLKSSSHHPGALAPLVLAGAAMTAFYTLLAGPQLFRQDLRSDLANADILKTYPLAGWQVILGEILTPALVLSGILWLTLLVAGWAWMSLMGSSSTFAATAQATLILCVGVIIPLVVLLQLLVPNGAALLFPAWHQASRTRGAGPEAIGQRLIFVVGQLFAIVLALLPAALAGLLIFLATIGYGFFLDHHHVLGLPTAIVLATAGVAAVIAGELGIVTWWLGTRFERLDIAMELRP